MIIPITGRSSGVRLSFSSFSGAGDDNSYHRKILRGKTKLQQFQVG
jgi:hypothetical protein